MLACLHVYMLLILNLHSFCNSFSRLASLGVFAACISTERLYLLSTSHCTKNPFYVLLEMKLGGLIPNSYIHVSVSYLYIPRISLPIWLQ
jgi:hypothetical protein